jgi:hypothetical protein
MNRRARYAGGAAILLAFTSAGPVPAGAAEPVDLPALERAWHSCVRTAYDQQPDHTNRAGRERNALDECKPHEDRYVAALMAARPADDLPLNGWARTWAAYVAFVVDPVRAWIQALRR